MGCIWPTVAKAARQAYPGVKTTPRIFGDFEPHSFSSYRSRWFLETVIEHLPPLPAPPSLEVWPDGGGLYGRLLGTSRSYILLNGLNHIHPSSCWENSRKNIKYNKNS